MLWRTDFCYHEKILRYHQRIKGVVYFYDETRENADERYQLVYAKAVTLTNKFGTEVN